MQVLEQLAYLGVLEVVRIRQQGFPTRMPYHQLFARFSPLLLKHEGATSRGPTTAGSR